MDHSRRACCLSLPALLLSAAAAAKRTEDRIGNLASKAYTFENLPVHAGGQNNLRPVLQGATHAGWPIELHESDLAPGGIPHPPHHHLHDEMFLVREGTLEVVISGRASRLGPGSVAFIASNEEHGIRNAGTGRAQYFVLALGKD
jgi:mannose-6-phosphate isomerase-like protein (cupin superfamily)